jgi:twitching motility protein PilT
MGRDLGMQLLDQALLAAITARTIDPDDAYAYASDKRPFQKYVTDTSMLPKVDVTGSNPAAGAGAAKPATANSST